LECINNLISEIGAKPTGGSGSGGEPAYLLDPQNALALAFYAEVLLDQQKWDQALEYSEQAVLRSGDLMDTHRVYGTVLESTGSYRSAIDEYEKASQIAPNLTFLLMRIGLGYATFNRSVSKARRNLYDTSCTILTGVTLINSWVLTLPHIAIAKPIRSRAVLHRRPVPKPPATRQQRRYVWTVGNDLVQARNESRRYQLKLYGGGEILPWNLSTRACWSKLCGAAWAQHECAFYYIRYGSGGASIRQSSCCDKSFELMSPAPVWCIS
jgi:tetratricopeptide (TPR) repeat protein